MDGVTHADIFFTDPAHGWIAAGGPAGPGALFRTRDGGRSWDEVARQGCVAHGHRFYCVWFCDPATGWLCGEQEDGLDGVVWATRDGGESWDIFLAGTPGAGLPSGQPFTQICFPSRGLGFLLAGGIPLLASRDGGRSWAELPLAGERPWGMTFLPGDRTGFLLSQEVDHHRWRSLHTMHYRTDDGGETWQEVNDRFLGTRGGGVDVAACRYWEDGQHGLLCGPDGTLFLTADGARHWWPVRHPFGTADLNHLALLPGGTAYLCGEGGTLGRSTDFGLSWEKLPAPASTELHGLVFFPDGRGFLVGEAGLALGTADHGQSWQRLELRLE